MDKPSFGKFEKVSTRDYFRHEARNFTPWLANNLGELGEAIAVELQVESQEKNVGPFSADLICRIAGTDKHVVVENQFGSSDHEHLGKLLTYAAGLSAQCVVWVAEEFTEQHRSVFEWLNENTSRDLRAFAVKFRLERIGKSLPAPRFEVVAEPNDWEKEQRIEKEESTYNEKNKRYVAFWRGLDEYVKGGVLVGHGDPRPNYWRRFEMGKPGFFLTAVVWDPIRRPDEAGIIAELTIRGANRLAYFSRLKRKKAEIQNRIGEEMEWRAQKDGSQSVIASSGSFEGWSEQKWPSYYKWFKEKLTRFHQTFRPLVMAL